MPAEFVGRWGQLSDLASQLEEVQDAVLNTNSGPVSTKGLLKPEVPVARFKTSEDYSLYRAHSAAAQSSSRTTGA